MSDSGADAPSRLPTLEGERVRLRRITDADAEALFDVFGDPEVVRYWSSPPLEDLEDAHALVREIQAFASEGTLLQWGVVRRDSDELVGTCTLADIDRRHGRAEVGAALARRHWGRGWMREAFALLLDHAFGDMGLRRIEADVDVANMRALRLLERFGFTREGLIRERWLVEGEPSDAIFMGLLAREWSASARGSEA